MPHQKHNAGHKRIQENEGKHNDKHNRRRSDVDLAEADKNGTKIKAESNAMDDQLRNTGQKRYPEDLVGCCRQKGKQQDDEVLCQRHGRLCQGIADLDEQAKNDRDDNADDASLCNNSVRGFHVAPPSVHL